MPKILLVRPGATEFDRQGRIQGTLDIPLCEDGHQAVKAMVGELRSLPIEAIYTSPSQSAEQTAEALYEAIDVKPKRIEELENLDHGLWQGLLISDVKVKQPKVYRQWQEQPEIICPPQGETITAAKSRVRAALTKLAKKHKADALIVLVVPEPLASVVCHVLRQDELGDLWQGLNGSALWEVIAVPATVAAK